MFCSDGAAERCFIKKRSRASDLCLCRPRGEKTMGSRHLPLGALHLYWCHEETEAALHRPIKPHQQLATAALFSLHSLSSSLSVSLHFNLSPSLCIFHSNTPPPPLPHGPFAVILPPDGTTERASVPLLPSPMTNIYRAALIYSGLISES